MKNNKILCLLTTLLLMAASFSNATLIYDEDVSGDLDIGIGTFNPSTQLTLLNGLNTVAGNLWWDTGTNDNDGDAFRAFLGDDLRLTGFNVSFFNLNPSDAFNLTAQAAIFDSLPSITFFGVDRRVWNNELLPRNSEVLPSSGGLLNVWILPLSAFTPECDSANTSACTWSYIVEINTRKVPAPPVIALIVIGFFFALAKHVRKRSCYQAMP